MSGTATAATPGMLVSDMVEDIGAALGQFADAAGWRVGIAAYTDGPGSDISVMYAGSFDTDADGRFFLVPEGMGDAFELAERLFSARDLLDRLQAEPGWAGYSAYVRAEIVEMEDGSLACRNLPLWGAGVHEDARLVYFYYGATAVEA